MIIQFEIATDRESSGISEFEALTTALNLSTDQLIEYIDETEEAGMRKGLIEELKTLEGVKRRVWETFFKSMTQLNPNAAKP
jgi:hypothetical protein